MIVDTDSTRTEPESRHAIALPPTEVTIIAKQILIVEDESFIREMTVAFLSDAGLSTIEAASADRALDILERDAAQICLLFTDVRMPGQMDGLDLARCAIDRWPHIKVIVTNGAFTKITDEVPPGADFLPKPWLPLDMLTRITRAASGACQNA